MRLVLFFDLPMGTPKAVKAYTKFLKEIKKEGFLMLQNSVYTKLAITNSKANAVMKKIKSFLPSDGVIDVLIVTEKQFRSMITLIGEHASDVINSDERLIEL